MTDSSVQTLAPERLDEEGGANLRPGEPFVERHVGPDAEQVRQMLESVGLADLDALVSRTVPAVIRQVKPLDLPPGRSEHEVLSELRKLAKQNTIFRSFLGQGYSDCITPPVLQRNILENPGWYTAYTPYQAEIAQGRLEALLNFQTMILDLTALEVANASLLDEATAAAEAMSMSLNCSRSDARIFFVDEDCHPQTVEVVRTRAWPLGIEVVVGSHDEFAFSSPCFGALVQYPTTHGAIHDYGPFVARAHDAGALVTVAADLLSLTLLRPPGEFGADIAVGSTQRFGLPMGFGGPHAAYLATREAYKRHVPGRIVGVSKDVDGNPALRLALQTREQHIRRARATSNICTAQVLPAVVAAMFAVYHGPRGLARIAGRIRRLTTALAQALEDLGYEVSRPPYFDTLRVEVAARRRVEILERAHARRMNLRVLADEALGLSLDETTCVEDLNQLIHVFSGDPELGLDMGARALAASPVLEPPLARTSSYLDHPVFHRHHSETAMLRYLHRLEARDLSLTTSMIPLGSCTMKLNATAEMMPVTWPEFAAPHPFAPRGQVEGYLTLCRELEDMLAEITGFAAISLQPNAGSQGELAGLLVVRKYHDSRGEGDRKVCLIPESAHGTNPASAVMAGLEVVAVRCDSQGNIDLADLDAKAKVHRHRLAALMVTYPSTHGVFEEKIREICETVHRCGGQVYMDGANLNAQVGLCRPGDYGADVCHLNLHKTFCIPHGGGGPGMGPIGVMPHLVDFLPGHTVVGLGAATSMGSISQAPYGSGAILPISWAYIALMGREGLARASAIAILNANYVARRLDPYYPVLYRGTSGLVAHECILDLRPLKKAAGVEVEDVAKRLMDYGFHAPTVSWPVAGTLMIEPTESESKTELDRFCDAMILIRQEIEAVAEGQVSLTESVLRNAPHTARQLLAESWDRPYSRELAAYPAAWSREHKYWPPVGRIDSAYGDRNLVCSCPPMDAYDEVASS